MESLRYKPQQQQQQQGTGLLQEFLEPQSQSYKYHVTKEPKPLQKLIRPEWLLSNKMRYAGGEMSRQQAELLSLDLDSTIENAGKMGISVGRDVDKKLEQRVKEMEHWKNESSNCLEEIQNKIDDLSALEVRVEKALESVLEPMHINDQCIEIRNERKGIELVHDEAEREMIKEKNVYEGVQGLLKRVREELKEKIRLARKTKYNLNKQLNDREKAIYIDKHNLQLRNHAFDLQLQPFDLRGLGNKKSTEKEWELFSNEGIIEAGRVLDTCRNMESLVLETLKQTAEDMDLQTKNTNFALKERIEETREAKRKMEDHLSLIKSQILESESYLEKVEKTIKEKEEPMKLAIKRLQNRELRPNVEKCEDEVERKLLEETRLINHSVEMLKATSAKTFMVLQKLREEQKEMEEDIKLKELTLLLDEAQCWRARCRITIRKF